MKKTTLFTMLTMLLLFVSSNVWADDEPFYTLETVPFATGSNHTSYNDYYDDVHDGMIWNAPGNQSLEGKWRIGGKSTKEVPFDKVDRTITAKTPMGSAINRVVVNHLGVSKSSFVVNSMKLTIASDVEYKTVLDEVTLTPDVSAAGSVEFLPSTGTEWATEAYYKLTINVTNPTTSNAGIDLTSIEFFAPGGGGGVTVAKPVITPDGGTFAEAQTVTITAGEGCTVFYTTDGTDPTSESTEYTAAFTVSENCTVKAIAYDADDNASSIASAEFSFTTGITSIAELCALTPASGTISVTVVFNNWVVTGVKGKNAYFTDGANGVLLYQDGHAFEVGDQLTGTATFNLTTYKNAPEITGLKSTTEGVTIAAKNVAVNPIPTTIGQLEKNMQGCVVQLGELTYDGSVFKDEAGASITPYGTFMTLPTLEKGKTYNVKGVAVWFDKWEIAPRTADDFQEVSVLVAAPTITPAGGTYAEPQEVTITAEEGCTIYYTLDGTAPSDASTQYTAPFTISESCTVKAIAYNDDDNASKVTSAEFTFIVATAIPNIAELCAAAPAEGEKEVFVEFNNWIVTGVKGGQVFFTDGANGIVSYKSGHGFEVGDVLTGSAVVTLTTFNECAEITSLTSTTTGLTVTKGEGATPMNVAIADLTKDMQGCLLSFEGLTYDGSAFVDDDDNTIVPNNKFIAVPELMKDKTYNVTGVAVWYVSDAGGHWEIAPRTAEEYVLVTSLLTPVSSWSVETEKVDVNGEVTAVFTTDSDGEVTYTSSDEDVATVDSEGNITPVGRGTTTITANVAESNTYLPDSKSFTLVVTEAGYEDALFVYNDEDIVGQGAPDTGAELTATRNDVLTLYANKAYAKTGDTHIKFYGSKYEGEGEEKTLTDPSYIKLSVPDNYLITDIVLTATSENYNREWKDQNGNATVIETNTATWKGELQEVILTNQATSQARIKTISVTYMNVDEIGITSVSADVKAGAIYNLAGQRLSKMQKGINIVGGKKILK